MEKICFKTAKGPAAVGPYSTAVIYGDTIYMSGMIGVDPAVQKPVEGGTLAQAKQVFENIVTVLGELGVGHASHAPVHLPLVGVAHAAVPRAEVLRAEYVKLTVVASQIRWHVAERANEALFLHVSPSTRAPPTG